MDQHEIRAERGVGQGGRLVLGDDQIREAFPRGQRFDLRALRPQPGLPADRQPVALLLEHDHGRGRRAEHLLGCRTDVLHHRLLGAGQAGRIQQLLQHVLAVRSSVLSV